MNKKIFLSLNYIIYPLVKARLSLKDQALFAKRLSMLVKAGVPLLKSISLLENQMRSKANKKMLAQISNDIANGQFLFKSLGKFKQVFSTFTINIIRVGETTGTLAENLKYLAEEMDKKRLLNQKIISALIYPIVIIISAFSVSGVMTIYLFPKLLPVFKSLHITLPLVTRILIFISDFLQNYYLIIIISVIILIISFILLMRQEKFRFFINKLSLNVPLIGTLLTHYHLINICRTLGNLNKSNVHILEAVKITAETSSNLVYKKELESLYNKITMGENIATHLEKNPKLFPKLFSQMIAISEVTGNLSETLIYLGEIYEQELDEQTKRFSAMIEPLMMIIMGIVVGFIAISIITPIYEVTEHLTPK